MDIQPLRQRFRCLRSAIVALLLISSCHAVLGQIINVPPSPSPASAGSGTTVNLLPGGTLANFFIADSGSTLNVIGGTVYTAIGKNQSTTGMVSGEANTFVAEAGSLLKIEGGRVIQIQAESLVDVRGGRIGLIYDYQPTADIRISGGAIERLQARTTTVTLSGLDFKVNGVPIANLNLPGENATVTIAPESLITGVLADGRAFAHYQNPGETDPTIFHLVRSTTPTPPPPSITEISAASDIEWIGNQQQLVISAGGRTVQHFRAGPGSRLTVNGGYAESGLHVVSGEINLMSGWIGWQSKYFDDSVVNIFGGRLESNAAFYSGATLNAYGGEISGAVVQAGATANIYAGNHYSLGADNQGTVNVFGGEISSLGADDGGTLNIHGGRVTGSFSTTGASVNLYGGAVSDYLDLRSGSRLSVYATELRRNGVPINGLQNPGDALTVSTQPGDFLSGVFADGTPFVLGGEEYNLPASVKVVQSNAYAAGPSVIHVPSDPAPQGIHNGQTLILDDGGALPTLFTASHGSRVEIRGGTVGFNFEAIGAEVDLSGGQISTLDAFGGTAVRISGNSQWGQIELYADTTADISGGVGGGINLQNGSTLNFSSGEIRGAFSASQAHVNITGGTIAQYQQTSAAYNLSHVTMAGGYVKGLAIGESSLIEMSGGQLGELSVGTNSTAEIDGGQTDWLTVHGGAVAYVRAGIMGDIDNFEGGTTRLYGGALGDSQEWGAGTVEINGYDFQVNGVPVTGLDAVGNSRMLNYAPGSTITGTLADGTPFNLAPDDNYQSLAIAGGVLRLVRSATPTLPTAIYVPAAEAPYGASAGQTIILQDGGALGRNFLAGRASRVEIDGGSVGDNFEADRSDVIVTGGSIGNRWDVFGGAKVEVSGGSLGDEFEIHAGGMLHLQNGTIGHSGQARGGIMNMSGGSLGFGFEALADSTVQISGGIVDSEFHALDGSKVYISGGSFGPRMEAASGSEVHISGGRIGSGADARTGSRVTISGGNILESFSFAAGSSLDLSGGNLGDGFGTNSAVDVVIRGVDFEINGVPVSGLDSVGSTVAVSITQNQLFTGTLADGTPFSFESGGVRQAHLVRAADLPSGPSEIHVPTANAPGGVRVGQHLVLHEGGSLAENFTAGRGSEVTILGGSVGSNFEAYQAAVDIQGGTIGNNADALAGARVNLVAGKIGTNFTAHGGSEFHVSGGSVMGARALAAAKVHLSGGQITNLNANNSSQTVWDGGTIGSLSVSGAASTLAIHGASFEIDGVPVTELENVGDARQIDLPANALLTAILADGTPLVLSAGLNSTFANAQIPTGVLSLVRSAEPGLPGPTSQVVTDANAPFAIGAGQSLKVLPGGRLPNYFVAGPDSHLQLLGGSIGSAAKAWGGKVDVFSGNVGIGFAGLEGLELAIHGGTFASGFTLLAGTSVDIFGGSVPSPFGVAPGTVIDVYGTSFQLNNQSIVGLQSAGDSVLITARGNQLLSGVLADGSPLSWRLSNYFAVRGITGISDQALLRVHLVPEPALYQVLASSAVLVLLVRRRPAIMEAVWPKTLACPRRITGLTALAR